MLNSPIMSTSGKTSADSNAPPRISVLMSVYNGEKYLREAIDSILAQSFRDFEFIVIDDASTDSTAEILCSCANSDSRIRLLRNEQNLGLTRSLNRGLAIARGQYVARMDADDISLPARFERQVKRLEENARLLAAGAWARYEDSQGNIVHEARPPASHALLRARLLLNNTFVHSSMMIRRDAIADAGGYNEKYRYAQDYDLWWRLSGRGEMSNLQEVLVRRREIPGNVSDLRRGPQREATLAISFAAVSECLAQQNETLEHVAYSRFWKALHRESAPLRLRDVRHLWPLWRLLADFPQAAEAHGGPIMNLGHRLILNRRVCAGLRLVCIAARQLRQPTPWLWLAKCLLFSPLPYSARQKWENFRSGSANGM